MDLDLDVRVPLPDYRHQVCQYDRLKTSRRCLTMAVGLRRSEEFDLWSIWGNRNENSLERFRVTKSDEFGAID